jgi:hypothetical protein
MGMMIEINRNWGKLEPRPKIFAENQSLQMSCISSSGMVI